MTIQAYPLQWPQQFPRAGKKDASRFNTTLPAALRKVQDSLRLFAKDSGKVLGSVVISSNYSLGTENPADPGVAVYFMWDGLHVCIPVDRYPKIADNLTAIHHVIEARRVELRHGTLALVRASFSGFAALPPPEPGKSWRAVLGIRAASVITKDDVQAAYRRLASLRHPDVGGTDDQMAELNAARDAALREVA